MKRLVETGDQEIATRINAYEMAYRMQTSAPELMDTSNGSQATLDMYGIKDPKESSFARNCTTNSPAFFEGQIWPLVASDHHGPARGPGETPSPLQVPRHRPNAAPGRSSKVGLAAAMLGKPTVSSRTAIRSTAMGEVRESTGRNHHIDAFTMSVRVWWWFQTRRHVWHHG